MAWVAAAQPASLAEHAQLQARAKAAFDREMAREKAGDCRDARTTLEINQCLDREVATTKANYEAFLGAPRALVARARNDEPEPAGPSGKPATRTELLAGFDATAVQWERYREQQCQAAYDLYKSGTAAPSQAGFCELALRRSHMRELMVIYEMPLSN